MADSSEETVLRKLKNGESLERAGLRDFMLAHADLERAKLCRSDLEGANLEGSNLRQGDLSSTNLREAYMAGVNFERANLQNANLEGANLDDANLQFADLRHANLGGATLERANLNGARLSYAQLEFTDLGRAILVEAQLDNANLCRSYLGGANLIKANLQRCRLDEVNLEEANLTGANLTETVLTGVCSERADFTDACLRGAVLENSSLANSNLKGADLRNCRFANANLDRTIFTAAKVFGIEADPDQLVGICADWVDFSAEGDGQLRVVGSQMVDCFERMKTGMKEIPASTSPQPKRFFGPGDVLRGATLEFSEDSRVEIESYLENCQITLGHGTRLTVGPHGVLTGCQLIGGGEISIWGKFQERNSSPGIVGPSRLHVGKTGTVVATIHQPLSLTEFGFEHGCRLNLVIRKSPNFKGE